MLLLSSFFLALFLLYTPVSLELQVKYQTTWQASLTGQYLFFKHTFKLTQQPWQNESKTITQEKHLSNDKIYQILKKIWLYAQKKYFIQNCSIKCTSGFNRPDFTAYSYGLLWAVLSILPPSWQEWLTIDYKPHFQGKTFHLDAQGIIYLPLGYLILILIYTLLLFSSEIWQQKREERKNNENRLCRQFDGCSNG